MVIFHESLVILYLRVHYLQPELCSYLCYHLRILCAHPIFDICAGRGVIFFIFKIFYKQISVTSFLILSSTLHDNLSKFTSLFLNPMLLNNILKKVDSIDFWYVTTWTTWWLSLGTKCNFLPMLNVSKLAKFYFSPCIHHYLFRW